MMSKRKTYYVICLSNEGYRASLEPRKLYVAVTDPDAEKEGLVRVIDESGEDYLYPSTSFAPIILPRRIELALAAS